MLKNKNNATQGLWKPEVGKECLWRVVEISGSSLLKKESEVWSWVKGTPVAINPKDETTFIVQLDRCINGHTLHTLYHCKELEQKNTPEELLAYELYCLVNYVSASIEEAINTSPNAFKVCLKIVESGRFK